MSKYPYFENVCCFGIAVIIGAFAFQYTLWNAFEKNAPWYADLVAGFVCPVWVLTSIMIWIAKLCDAATPFFV